MHFLAHIRQESKGCDYTIGCGEKTWMFEAGSWDDAVARLKCETVGIAFDDNHPGFWDEKRLKQVFLVQIMLAQEMPIRQWYDEVMAEYSKIEHQEKEAEERLLYERLKHKFEEGNK